MTTLTTFTIHLQLTDNLYIKGYNGRVVHGAFLQFIREYDEELSNYLHESQDKRSYSLTEMDFNKLGDTWSAYFDINTYDTQIIDHMIKLMVNDQAQQIFIVDRFCPIIKIEFTKHNIPDPTEIKTGTSFWMNFKSPTVFATDKRSAKSDPYPHINTIWQQIVVLYSRIVDEIDSADQAFLIQYLLNQVATPNFKLRSTHLKLAHKIKITGFRGSILFVVENNEHLELLIPMLKLAEIWGIGSKTTMGFGQLDINMREPRTDEGMKDEQSIVKKKDISL